jgi:hypothetical protein
MDVRTLAGGIPAARPRAMLTMKRARNAWRRAKRIRTRRRPMEAAVMRMKYVPWCNCEYMIYRICFPCKEGYAYEVEIADYHS